MGYSTDFNGMITLNKPMDDDTHTFLTKLSETRRMGRKGLDPKYGIEGEYYVEDDDKNVIDGNRPPKTQPSLWCGWKPTDDKQGIEWDGGEKTYSSKEWIEYIVNKILAPKGYIANGTIEAQGEDMRDHYWIDVKDNVVSSRSLEEMQTSLTAAEERVKLLETPSDELPLLINQVWVDPENQELFDRLLKSQKNQSRAIELLKNAYLKIEDKTLKAQIKKYLKEGGE